MSPSRRGLGVGHGSERDGSGHRTECVRLAIHPFCRRAPVLVCVRRDAVAFKSPPVWSRRDWQTFLIIIRECGSSAMLA